MASAFARATKDYYRWLGTYLTLDADGLREKQRRMAGTDDEPAGVFPFLRGTFYLWRDQFAATPAAVRAAPSLLAAGDLHLENFGTWRDAEGRLVWGVNDFDEAAVLPFTSDLVRLATSLLIARRDDPTALALGRAQAVAAMLEGYRAGLEDGGPFILEGAVLDDIRRTALGADQPGKTWAKARKDGDPAPLASLDPDLATLLLTALPQGARGAEFRKLHKGLGSLGRARFLVIAQWQGGPVAREAKATAPSAHHLGKPGVSRVRDHRHLVAEARRAHDPGFLLTRDWVLRRVSPEMRKIELKTLLPKQHPPGPEHAAAQAALLGAMGGEVANLHAGTTPDRAALLAWLDARDTKGGWLLEAARAAEQAVLASHREFMVEPDVVARIPAARRAA